MAPVFADLDPTHALLVITDRPDNPDFAPLPAGADPINARISAARDVSAGDLILAELGYWTTQYGVDAYPAAPVPFDSTCECPGCDTYPPDATELVVITQGFPWDMCDVHFAHSYLLIIPAAPLSAS